jgi:DNA-binding beta-propeller fold protein YncE
MTWGPSSVVCDIEFVTLATHQNQSSRLFAVGRSAVAAKQGLYRFTLPTIPLLPTPLITFNATGLFAIDTNGTDAVATANSNTAVLDGTFNGLRRINLNTLATSAPPAFAATGRNDYDDLAIANGAVYLTGTSGGSSSLFRFTLAPEAAQAPTALGPLSTWRLALMPASNALAIVDANTYRARMFHTSTATLVNTMRIPLQIMPISMSVRPDESEVYALNMSSNTVSAVNVNMLMSGLPSFTAEPPTTLAAYRKQMLDAFTDLAGGADAVLRTLVRHVPGGMP